MRYAVSTSQHNFFQKEGLISYEIFLNEEQMNQLEIGLEKEAAKRTSGYNLHLENSALYKQLLPSKLGQLALSLFEYKALRIAFTTYCRQQGNPYSCNLSFPMISSLSETVGGALLFFSSPHRGTLSFYHHRYLIPLLETNTPYLLIGFASDKARYLHQPSDPYTHVLKKYKYGFGDLILTETHPLLPFSNR